jgi:hypothetical protein
MHFIHLIFVTILEKKDKKWPFHRREDVHVIDVSFRLTSVIFTFAYRGQEEKRPCSVTLRAEWDRNTIQTTANSAGAFGISIVCAASLENTDYLLTCICPFIWKRRTAVCRNATYLHSWADTPQPWVSIQRLWVHVLTLDWICKIIYTRILSRIRGCVWLIDGFRLMTWFTA